MVQAIDLRGVTNSGKTSLAHTLAPGNCCGQVGNASGLSTTKGAETIATTTRDGHQLLIIDAQGTDDTSGVSNDKIEAELVLTLAEHGPPVHDNGIKTIFVESFNEDARQIERGMDDLCKHRGNPAMGSVVVAVTQFEDCDPEDMAARLAAVHRFCDPHNIPVVKWLSHHTDANGNPVMVPENVLIEQENNLMAALASRPAYQISEVTKLEDKIQERAKQLHAAMKTEKVDQVTTVSVAKTRTKYRNEPYQATRKEKEEYMDVEWYRGSVSSSWGSFFGQTKMIPRDVKKTRMIDVPYTAYRSVADGTETYYVNERKSVKVDKPKPDVATFLPTARKQVIDEMRQARKMSVMAA